MPRLALVRVILVAIAVVALYFIVTTAIGLARHDGSYTLVLRPFCTVAASLALLAGAVTGLCGRTWGVLLCVLSAISYGGAFVFGIAPAWFLGVAALGLALLVAVAAPLWRSDRAAFAVAFGAAVALGAGAAALAGPGIALAWDLALLP